MRFLSPLFILTALFAQESAEFRNWLEQGAQAFRNAQYAAGIQAFQRAIELNPFSLTAHLYLATAYMQRYIPGAESDENSQMAVRAKDPQRWARERCAGCGGIRDRHRGG